MIRLLLGESARIRFRTYDIDEHGAIVTCDGDTLRTRVYADAEEFLFSALRGRPPPYFCLGGGRDQIQPILHVALNYELDSVASFYGATATRVTITAKDGKHRARFVDAEGLLPETLETLCDWCEIKLRDTAAGRAAATAALMNRMQDLVMSLGGAMHGTLPSCAYDIFRRVYLRDSFKTDSNLNKRAKRALYPGRTEVHLTKLLARASNSKLWPGVVDMNGAYGGAMVRGPIPGPLVRVDRKRAPCSISLVDVEIPEGAFPSLPYRTGAGIFYPIGRWRDWYHESVLSWAEQNGARVHEVKESLHFQPWKEPGEFARRLYERRALTNDPFERKVLKSLIQSLAGRLAMRTGYERLLCFPKERKCPHDGEHDTEHGPTCFRPLRAGVYIVTDPDRAAATAHVAATAGINAIALAMLNEGVRLATSKESKVAYLGTDALHLDRPWVIPTGRGLGDFRLVRRFAEGEYISALWYRTDEDVTAAGLPGATVADWRALMAGIDVAQPIRFSVKESIARGGIGDAWRSWHARRLCSTCYRELLGETCILHPWSAALPADTRPRRVVLPDGTTRPWHVEQLRDPWHEYRPGSGARMVRAGRR